MNCSRSLNLCLTLVALFAGLLVASSASAQSCGAMGGTHCSQSGFCPDGFVSLGDSEDCAPCCVEEPPPSPSCGELGGNYCSQSGVCPQGYQNLGVSYDCNPCCVAGPSCGALGGDYCSQSGSCPPGATSLGTTFDCNPCCLRAAFDDAEVVSSDLPARLACGQSVTAFVTMRNSGTSTWTSDVYRLGAVDDSDPLTSSGRVFLPQNIAPEGMYTFAFTLTAPDEPGSYLTDWRMVHEGVRWFGATASRRVSVDCEPPPSMPPLTISGNRFFAGTREVNLIGGAVCCEDYPASGWPFISPSYISLFGQHKLNYVHIRTGPHTRNNEQPIFEGYKWIPEEGKYDLNQFEPAFVSHLRSTLQATLDAGIYTEVDLVDAWPPRNGVSPFNGQNNVNGYDAGGCGMFRRPPDGVIEAWVRHIVRETASYPHVMYQVGNETEVCRSTSEFELGVYQIAKDEMARLGVTRPVGTQSGHDGLDYRAYHGFFVPVPESIPVLVNETDNEYHSPEEYAARMRLGLQRGGVYFQGWRGPLNQDDFLRLLELIQDIAEGRPDPPGMACPSLNGTRIHVHNVPGPGHYVIDASPVGLGPEGDDHRQFCESVYYDGADERGPSWRIVGGTGDGHADRNPYLFHAFPTPSMQIQACTQSGEHCSNILTLP